MRPPRLVVGAGSPHGDDQIGWHLAEALSTTQLPGTELVAVGVPIDLLHLLDSPRETLVILDAVRSTGPRWGVKRLSWPDDRVEVERGCSSHGLGIAEVLTLAAVLGRLPNRVVILAIEIGITSTIRDDGPAPQERIRELASQVEAMIQIEFRDGRPVPGATCTGAATGMGSR